MNINSDHSLNKETKQQINIKTNKIKWLKWWDKYENQLQKSSTSFVKGEQSVSIDMI